MVFLLADWKGAGCGKMVVWKGAGCGKTLVVWKGVDSDIALAGWKVAVLQALVFQAIR